MLRVKGCRRRAPGEPQPCSTTGSLQAGRGWLGGSEPGSGPHCVLGCRPPLSGSVYALKAVLNQGTVASVASRPAVPTVPPARNAGGYFSQEVPPLPPLHPPSGDRRGRRQHTEHLVQEGWGAAPCPGSCCSQHTRHRPRLWKGRGLPREGRAASHPGSLRPAPQASRPPPGFPAAPRPSSWAPLLLLAPPGPAQEWEGGGWVASSGRVQGQGARAGDPGQAPEECGLPLLLAAHLRRGQEKPAGRTCS